MRDLSPDLEKKLTKIESMVGKTPLLRLDFLMDEKPVCVFAKYEAVNFSGSIKDRMAIKILRSAYTSSDLNPGDLIVEATSGNTGIAFSAMGAFLQHPVRICPSQFSNWQNIEAHRETTGPEIARAFADLGLRPDAFVAGAGTGGTIMGVSAVLKMENINLKSHPVFPLNHEENGGTHRIEGIGDSFVPEILKLKSLHREIRVDDEDAIVVAQMLNKKGLSVGISSGANIWAALSVASKSNKNVITILCDSAMKYLTTDLCKPAKKQITNLKFVGFDKVG
jgi:cysteine synthase A